MLSSISFQFFILINYSKLIRRLITANHDVIYITYDVLKPPVFGKIWRRWLLTLFLEGGIG